MDAAASLFDQLRFDIVTPVIELTGQMLDRYRAERKANPMKMMVIHIPDHATRAWASLLPNGLGRAFDWEPRYAPSKVAATVTE